MTIAEDLAAGAPPAPAALPRTVLHVHRDQPPAWPLLAAVLPDGGCRLQYPQGWVVASADSLIDPAPVQGRSRFAQLQQCVATARTLAAGGDPLLLALLDTVGVHTEGGGITDRELARSTAASAELFRVCLDVLVRSGCVVVSHRRGRAEVLRITALGVLTLHFRDVQGSC